jgi:6,7-dimethyl-8-ribityllumazine synthase
MTSLKFSPLKPMVIVASRFNPQITEALVTRCLEGFQAQNHEALVFWVPGAVEIPLMVQRIIERFQPAAVVALGCIIKGDTDHYDQVCRMCGQGIMEVMLRTQTPVVFEVLMVDEVQKALDRLDKAYEAAFIATEMVKTLGAVDKDSSF